jgi:hypothetical protein
MWPFKRKRQPLEVISNATIITYEGHKVNVTLVEAKYFSPRDMVKVKKALSLLCKVVNSTQFRDGILYTTYTSTNDSPTEILAKMYKANERNTGDDYEMDFSLQYYNSWWSKVIGYTVPSSVWVWLNWKYHMHFTPSQMAGNLMHEFCHKIGYDHSSHRDYSSVPYYAGYLVEQIGAEYENYPVDASTYAYVDLV